MAKECQFCGKSLPITRRLLGKALHDECEKEQKLLLDQYRSVVQSISGIKDLTEELKSRLENIESEGKFSDMKAHKVKIDFYESVKFPILQQGEVAEHA